MLTNSDITTIHVALCITLFILTLNTTERLMGEITFFMHVKVRNNVAASVSRIMRETW